MTTSRLRSRQVCRAAAVRRGRLASMGGGWGVRGSFSGHAWEARCGFRAFWIGGYCLQAALFRRRTVVRQDGLGGGLSAVGQSHNRPCRLRSAGFAAAAACPNWAVRDMVVEECSGGIAGPLCVRLVQRATYSASIDRSPRFSRVWRSETGNRGRLARCGRWA